MNKNIKNIIIFTVIAVILILIYIFFIKKPTDEPNLVSGTAVTDNSNSGINNTDQNSLIIKDLLSVLLGVKNIKLDDTLFSSKSFSDLHDSSILLTPPANQEEGRSNPFAPIGTDVVTQIIPATPVSPVTPPSSSTLTPDKTAPLTPPSTSSTITPPATQKKIKN